MTSVPTLRLRSLVLPLVASLTMVSPVCGQSATALANRLEQLRSPGAASVAIELTLHQERRLHGKSASGDAVAKVEVDASPAALGVRWDTTILRAADTEEHERDQDSGRLTPSRDAMKELDPGRIAHLLDQTGTLAGLTKGKAVEDAADTREGQPVRRLVFAFHPRLTWTETYYLRHADGRFTVFVGADGTPLESLSVATYDGKTSRTFGRFEGKSTLRTRYVVEAGRLRVAERDLEERHSADDGGEISRTVMRFAISPLGAAKR